MYGETVSSLHISILWRVQEKCKFEFNLSFQNLILYILPWKILVFLVSYQFLLNIQKKFEQLNLYPRHWFPLCPWKAEETIFLYYILLNIYFKIRLKENQKQWRTFHEFHPLYFLKCVWSLYLPIIYSLGILFFYPLQTEGVFFVFFLSNSKTINWNSFNSK